MPFTKGQTVWCVEYQTPPRILERVYVSTSGVGNCVVDYPTHYEQTFSVKRVFGTELKALKSLLDYAIRMIQKGYIHLESVSVILEELNEEK